jgi:hypothetical protein
MRITNVQLINEQISVYSMKKRKRIHKLIISLSLGVFDLFCLTPLSAIFQLYHDDQF